MSTKLEAMVGLLAGRKIEPELLDELADPSSEASRFLEATRTRSRALLGEPRMLENPRPTRHGRGGLIALALLAIAAFVAFAVTLQVVDRRFRLLEASLEARDREARADALRLEAILQRLAEPKPAPEWPASFEESLKRIEAGLGRVEVDPSTAQIREEIAAIRRELSATDKLAIKRAEELQAAVHDAARVVRLLINRSEPPAPGQEGFNPPRQPVGGGDPRRPPKP